jgi:hypothetical protein
MGMRNQSLSDTAHLKGHLPDQGEKTASHARNEAVRDMMANAGKKAEGVRGSKQEPQIVDCTPNPYVQAKAQA